MSGDDDAASTAGNSSYVAPAADVIADDPRPEGPIMNFDTFHALGLDTRADAVSPVNPNDAFDPAVAAHSQHAAGIQAAAVQMEAALYQLGPWAQRPASPDRVPRGEITPFLRWSESSCFAGVEYDWWLYHLRYMDCPTLLPQDPADVFGLYCTL